MNIFKLRAFITISAHSILSLNLKFVDFDDSRAAADFYAKPSQ